MSCQHDSRTQENVRPQKCDLCVSLNFRIMKFIKMQNCPTASHIQVGVCVFFFGWVATLRRNLTQHLTVLGSL